MSDVVKRNPMSPLTELFDWFNSGTTKAQREAQHQIEIDNVSAQISNFFDLRKRYCS